MPLEISSIQIHPIRPINGLVGFAEFDLNNSFHIASVAIYTAPNHSLGYRLVFPEKTLANGKRVQFFYPYRKEIAEVVTKAIIEKYVELMDNFLDVEA